MTDQNWNHKIVPLTLEQLNSLQSIFVTLSDNQRIWLSGYLWGLINSDKDQNVDNVPQLSKLNNFVEDKKRITIVSASQTGNARRLAKKLYDYCILQKLDVIIFDAKDLDLKKISYFSCLIFIVSTYGEGEPPEEAVALYKYLFSKKAKNMMSTNFAVLSLGDRSYRYFAKAGKDLDLRLEDLGAKRLYKRTDLDLNIKDISDQWIQELVFILKEKIKSSSVIFDSNIKMSNLQSVQNFNYCQNFPLVAHLSEKQKITSRNSLKDVHHLEIDISGSNLCYKPGDALGVWYENDLNLVNELLEILNFTGNEDIKIEGKSVLLREALLKHFELTHNTFAVIQKLSIITKDKELLRLLSNKSELFEFIANNPIVDVMRKISIRITVQELLEVLCRMKPRFYSISSAQSEVGESVHITVGAVRYKIDNRLRTGGASGYLIDRLQEDDEIRIFVEPNNNFRLPSDLNSSVIMIGAGTGIAPFRSFMQQRAFDQALGKNWLFYGNMRFVDDFLYQVEWQNYFKSKLLTKIDTAWSRDQYNKIYVQDKLLVNGAELWSWVIEGAHVYVCGNAKFMARDVDRALIILAEKYGEMDSCQSREFWDNMKIKNRYQRDVY